MSQAIVSEDARGSCCGVRGRCEGYNLELTERDLHEEGRYSTGIMCPLAHDLRAQYRQIFPRKLHLLVDDGGGQ